MDGGTNKPREIDLIVEKHLMLNHKFGVRETRREAISVKLFMECKYITQPTVFWFSDKDLPSAREWVIRNTPLNREENMYTLQHHYLASNPRVAKLFATNKAQSGIENETIYKALNQSLNAAVYLRRRPSIIRELKERGIDIKKTVEMPIILVNSFSNFFRVGMDNPEKAEAIGDSFFQLEVNYAYANSEGSQRTEYFLIDVIDFTKLDAYFEVIDGDLTAISSFLRE